MYTFSTREEADIGKIKFGYKFDFAGNSTLKKCAHTSGFGVTTLPGKYCKKKCAVEVIKV